MENEKNMDEHLPGSAKAKDVVKTSYQKTISELERRNAHLHSKPPVLKKGKKISPA